MQAQMLSYSRAQGVFAGVSLSGTSLGPDDGDNEKIYGKKSLDQRSFGKRPATPIGCRPASELRKRVAKEPRQGKIILHGVLPEERLMVLIG